MLAENPHWKQNADAAKAKVEQLKDTMLQKADEFYLLTSQRLNQYISIQHKPEQSACRHLINEITGGRTLGQKQTVYYQCDHCERVFTPRYRISHME